jgi:hypothetical protein
MTPTQKGKLGAAIRMVQSGIDPKGDRTKLTEGINWLQELAAEPTSGPENSTVNCWTIYREGDNQLAQIGRPQDWGNQARWMYDVYFLEAHTYRNEVHCWLELLDGEELQPQDHLDWFSTLVTQILIPGTPRHESDRQYLAEDDFWDEAWGPAPPFYDEEDEDHDEEDFL